MWPLTLDTFIGSPTTMPIGKSVFSASPARRARNAARNRSDSGGLTARVQANARAASRAKARSRITAKPEPTRATPAKICFAPRTWSDSTNNATATAPTRMRSVRAVVIAPPRPRFARHRRESSIRLPSTSAADTSRAAGLRRMERACRTSSRSVSVRRRTGW